ncbi:hypothetical protein QTJ16_003621 [Diplocarpon rosae]|uniref:Uncharacterized protein n=1 Tax=Diplocarpon rosae TaxID=946125 RepID=A0AAD9WEN0_9HELO|nr:hypothetical protein QTJ16_003621 [Diplocarpon rosae]PBP22142.1 hypothetical protein BUE80_DR006934 [Diplocarpon rosae]
MIVRPGRAPHICLRCKNSLAKRPTGAASQVASQSTDSTHQNHLDKAAEAQDDGESYTSTQNLEGDVAKTDRFHGFRGMKKEEYREALKNEKTLGERAKVIVLRDSLLSLYNLGENQGRLPIQEAAHIDILGRLAEERGLVGQTEVDHNIDELRPTTGRQTWEEINELVRNMQEGFTMTQLNNYIEKFKQRRESERPEQEWIARKKDAGIMRVTPWVPGVSEAQDKFDHDILRGYLLESHTIKQRSIMRLLRECWMLYIPDLADGIGQFEVEFRKEDLELFLVGRTSVLDNIQSSYLNGEGEKLEAFRSRKVVRVTSPHVKKPFIVQEFEEALKRSRREHLNLACLVPPGDSKLTHRRVMRWMEKFFDSSTLQSLGELTNTSIVEGHRGALIISCIDDKEQALVSGVDVARRVLLSSCETAGRVERRLACESSSDKDGAFISTTIPDSLPWRHRLRDWVRWTAPTGKDERLPTTSDPEPAVQTAIRTSTSSPEVNGPQKVNVDKPSSSTSTAHAYWSDEYSTNISSVLGKVLHSSLARPPAPLGLVGFNQIHTFAAQAPNTSRIINKARLRMRGKGETTETLVLRFLPNPFHVVTHLAKGKYAKKRPFRKRPMGADAMTAFPAIEIRLFIDRQSKEEPKLKDVLAIVHEGTTDVMLPHNNIDLRFQQRTTCQMTPSGISKVITQYLEKCNFALRGRDSLQFPPSVKIPISKHLCRGAGFGLLGQELDFGGNEIMSQDVRDVPYLFAGLEIQRSLAFDYKDWVILYCSVEAGKAGGRRTELKLRPIRSGKIVDEKQFIDMAYQLAKEAGEPDLASTTGLKVGIRTVKGVPVRRVGSRKKPESEGFRLFDKVALDQTGSTVNWDDDEPGSSEDEG